MADTSEISTAELAQQLADMNKRNRARDELVKRGAQATPVLLNLAGTTQDIRHYKTILRTLLRIQDPRSEPEFRRALASGDEEIRVLGARGLHLLNAPDAFQALQVTINDCPDPLHFERTPAVDSLVERGLAALPTVFGLMESDRERSRQRGQYVLVSIVLANITQLIKPKPLPSVAQKVWEDLRQANGSYQWDAPESSRSASVRSWKRWWATLPSAGGSAG